MPIVDTTQRLPDNIEQGFIGGARWKTVQVEAASGRVERLQGWDVSIHEWDASYALLDGDEIYTLKTHHMRVRGSLLCFPFKDWSDFQTQRAEVVAVATGSSQEVQLYVTYGIAPINTDDLAYLRKIVLPIESTMVLYDNAVAMDEADWSLGEGGLVTFNRTASHIITWTGEFDVPVYFSDDHQKINMTVARSGRELGQMPSFSLIEKVDFT